MSFNWEEFTKPGNFNPIIDQPIESEIILSTKRKIIFLIEVLILIVAVFLTCRQINSYPLIIDPDPDGYVTYANHLAEHNTLMPYFRRYPGYPMFILLSRQLYGNSTHRSVMKTQTAICILFLLIFWFWVRRHYGIITGIIFLSIMALPNFLVRYAAMAFPDFLLGIGMFVLFIIISNGMKYESWSKKLLNFALIIAFSSGLQLLKPAASVVLLLFGGFLFLISIFNPKFRNKHQFHGTRFERCGYSSGLIACGFIVMVVTQFYFGKGPYMFLQNAMKFKIAIYLPPASNSPDELAIESGKDSFYQEKGYRVEDENYLGGSNYIKYISKNATDKAWKHRLMKFPFKYLGVILEDFKMKYILITQHYTPFGAQIQNPMYVFLPRFIDSEKNKIYRSTGLLPPIKQSLLYIVFSWSSFFIGIFILGKRHPYFIITGGLTFIAFTFIASASIFIDGRYILPFSIGIYVAQAIGLTSVFIMIWKSLKVWINRGISHGAKYLH